MEISKYSNEWWNNEFKSIVNWTNGIDGNIQTKYFADITNALISPSIKNNIKALTNKFVDFGCAYGQGLEMLQNLNENVEIVGVDFSDEALKVAKLNNPKNTFFKNINDLNNDDVDLIYASQIIGINPKDIINILTNKSKSYVILLTPYEFENNGIKIEKDTFEKCIWDKPEWRIIQNTIIDSTDTYYNGTKQILVVLKKIL